MLFYSVRDLRYKSKHHGDLNATDNTVLHNFLCSSCSMVSSSQREVCLCFVSDDQPVLKT